MKLLLSGDVNGNLGALEARVRKLNASAHGPFDVVFVVGGLLAPSAGDKEELDDYKSGVKSFPIPLYFVVGRDGLRSDAAKAYGMADPSAVAPACARVDVAPNITMLFGYGVDVVGGVKVAWLSGTFEPDNYFATSRSRPFLYRHADVEELCSAARLPGFRGVDVLLTSEWPAGYHNGLSAAQLPAIPSAQTAGSLASSAVAAQLLPRYHFAGSEGVYYQRAPYATSPDRHVCRFVGLACATYDEAAAADKSKKFLHALSLTCIDEVAPETLLGSPDGTTACPYSRRDVDTVTGGGVPAPTPTAVVAAASKRQRVDAAGGAGAGASVLAGDVLAALQAESDAITSGSDQFFFNINKMGKRQKSTAPPPTYVCKICRVAGHWIEDCPKKAEQDRLREAAGGAGQGPRHTGERKPPPATYTCKICHVAGHWIEDCPKKAEEDRIRAAVRAPDPRQECWFCLASPSIATHLLLSINDEVYLTHPKGGVTADHVLIVPVTHQASYAAAPRTMVDQIDAYKAALRRYFASKDEVPVVFERAVKTKGASHTHLQVIGVPKLVAHTVLSHFETECQKHDMTFKLLPSEASLNVETRGEQYFYAEVPDPDKPEKTLRILHLVPPGSVHPLQFGRVVFCSILGVPERKEWKACAVSVEEETLAADAFRKAFAPFDPAPPA